MSKAKRNKYRSRVIVSEIIKSVVSLHGLRRFVRSRPDDVPSMVIYSWPSLTTGDNAEIGKVFDSYCF